jgi:SAM-dependent methyltransferase
MADEASGLEPASDSAPYLPGLKAADLIVQSREEWWRPAGRRECLPDHGLSLPGFYGAIYMWPEEFEMLSRYVARAERMLEVGTFCGAAAAYLTRVHPRLRIWSVDKFAPATATGGGIREVFWKNMMLARPGGIMPFVGDSREILPTLDEQFDVALVDADHSYEACLADGRNSWRLLRRGGALLFHDYGYVRSVIKAVDEFAAEVALPLAEQQSSLVAIIKPDAL